MFVNSVTFSTKRAYLVHISFTKVTLNGYILRVTTFFEALSLLEHQEIHRYLGDLVYPVGEWESGGPRESIEQKIEMVLLLAWMKDTLKSHCCKGAQEVR